MNSWEILKAVSRECEAERGCRALAEEELDTVVAYGPAPCGSCWERAALLLHVYGLDGRPYSESGATRMISGILRRHYYMRDR